MKPEGDMMEVETPAAAPAPGSTQKRKIKTPKKRTQKGQQQKEAVAAKKEGNAMEVHGKKGSKGQAKKAEGAMEVDGEKGGKGQAKKAEGAMEVDGKKDSNIQAKKAKSAKEVDIAKTNTNQRGKKRGREDDEADTQQMNAGAKKNERKVKKRKTAKQENKKKRAIVTKELVRKLFTTPAKTAQPQPAAGTFLYVDAISVCARWFRLASYWDLEQAVERAEEFCNCAEASGLKIKIFIDTGSLGSNMPHEKWVEWTAAEVLQGYKRDIENMPILLGDAFRKNGVEVHYSTAHIRDTIAAYAQQDGAAVLGSHQDYCGYIGRTYPIYGAYSLEGGKLVLEALEEKTRPDYRPLPNPPPQTIQTNPGLVSVNNNIYRRGSPSDLVGLGLPNPHIAARPLRQALYARQGLTGPIREVFPEVENKKVVWRAEDVLPDPTMDALLDNPSQALATIFPKPWTRPEYHTKYQWDNHTFALHTVIYEICFMDGRCGDSLLDLLLATRSAVEAKQKKGGAAGKKTKPKSSNKEKGKGKKKEENAMEVE